MAWKYMGKNYRPFSALCDCQFGRKVIFTNKNRIDGSNIVQEVQKAMSTHRQNAMEIDYLDRYYKGDQPIRYRKKVNRPEVNNKIVENLAYYIVETKTSEMVGEPIQYVLHGTEQSKSKEIATLNEIMESEDKAFFDIELDRWRHICGTAYRFIGNDDGRGQLLDESFFSIETEDPRLTFVAYYSNGRPAYSCQIRVDENDKEFYFCYTDGEWFKIQDGEILDSGINGNGAIPVIEYPNNARRISDIEITIDITDELNKMASDRANGIEQFVSSWVKFVNCEIDVETYQQMRQEGALVVKSNNGSENKADVDVMTSELDQSQSQTAVDDQYEKMLVIQGMANRQENAAGDTQGAVQLRNGHYDAEKRAELYEPIFKRAERMSLRIILNRLRIKKDFTLMPSDVEIHISRSKVDNMQVKATVLQILLACGIDYGRAIKTVGLFSDPEQVAVESRKRMEYIFPDEDKEQKVEVVKDGNADENRQTEQPTIETT